MPVYLAGSLVDGMVGWAPISGNQPMSFTIYSYDGEVTVGIACDTTLVPDHEMIVDGFAGAFGRLVESTPSADLMQITWGGAGKALQERAAERSRPKAMSACRPTARIRSSKSSPLR